MKYQIITPSPGLQQTAKPLCVLAPLALVAGAYFFGQGHFQANKYMKYLLLIIGFLTASSAHSESLKNESEWTNNCYKNFYKHITLISGNDAINCGFADINTTTSARVKIQKCAKDAVKLGTPYKFGYAAYGIDSAFCQVAIKDNEGRLWSVLYDTDVSGGSGEKAEPVLWVSECKKLLFRSATISKGSFFDHEQCEKNTEVAKKVLATP